MQGTIKLNSKIVSFLMESIALKDYNLPKKQNLTKINQ